MNVEISTFIYNIKISWNCRDDK